MLARQRQRLILNMLENSPSLRTIELAKYFDVTDETIRRDLETLDAENKLIRTHGGALRIEKRSAELPLQKAPKRKPRRKTGNSKKSHRAGIAIGHDISRCKLHSVNFC